MTLYTAHTCTHIYMHVMICTCVHALSTCSDVSILLLWKSALELFVWNKSMLNSEHQFALVVLTDTAHWVSVCCGWVHAYTHTVCVHVCVCVWAVL